MTEFKTKHLLLAGVVGVVLTMLAMRMFSQISDTASKTSPARQPAAAGKSTETSIDSPPNKWEGEASIPRPAVPLPAITLPFSESYPELKRLSDQGDPWAACHLAVELMRCREALLSMQDTSRIRYLLDDSDLQELEPDAIARERKSRDESIERIKATAEVCADIPDDAIGKAQSYLRQSARAGLHQAQMLYIDGMGFDAQHVVTVLEDPAYKHWTREAPIMLQGLVRRGDAGAVLVLAGAYRHDQTLLNTLYDPDPEKELAYILLYRLLRGIPTGLSGTRFSQQQQLRALSEAKHMHREYFQGRLQTRSVNTHQKHWSWLPQKQLSEHACDGEVPHARP